MSLLFLERPAEALGWLEGADPAGSPVLADDILWYRAVAEERGGQPDGAREILDGLCAATGVYQERACDALAGW